MQLISIATRMPLVKQNYYYVVLELSYSLRQAMRILREDTIQTPRDLILVHLICFY